MVALHSVKRVGHEMVKKQEQQASSIATPTMSLFLPLLLLSFPLLLCSPFCSAQSNSTSSDANALLAFKSNVTIDRARAKQKLDSWNQSTVGNICTKKHWKFVICNSSRVSQLLLGNMFLSGPIPPNTLSRLDALQFLILESNNLSGGLPTDFAQLQNLRTLVLQSNSLSGPLSFNFSAWRNLSRLDISINHFSGSIPTALNNLTGLTSLNLQNNSFSGIIPYLNITSLVNFSVANNNLSGTIPDTLAKFPPSSFSGNANLCGPPLEACTSSPPQASKSKSNKLSNAAIVGIACGAVVAAVLLLLLLLLGISLLRKQKGHTRAENTEGVALEEVKRSLPTAGKEGEERNRLVFMDEKKLFDLDYLFRASAEVLGKGTIGTSYKAVLENGLIVAVKRLRDVNENRREEYRQRINGIGRLKNDNLVPLLAYYLYKEENLLVSEYMQKGSLSALLHGNSKTENRPLDWEMRKRIAATSAKGLAFLHAHDMVHGNIKSANVLLKSNLEASLADYIFVCTTSAHNIGYLAPEITDPCKITPKADVFSFGVLLLELLTGKVPSSMASLPPSSSTLATSSSPSAASSAEPVDLPRWVQSIVREEWTAEVFDPSLVQSGQPFNEEEMVDLLQVAMRCAAPSPDQRPSMVDVVQMIDNIRRITDDDKSSDREQSIASTSENQ